MPKKQTRNTGLPKIKQLKSGAYHAKIYTHTDENGKLCYKSFTNRDKNALILEMANFKADKKEAKIKGQTMTLQEAVDRYIDSKSAVSSPSTLKNYRRIAATKFLELMPVGIDDITPEMLQKAINTRALECAPKTVRNDYGLISSALKLFRPGFAPILKFPQKKKTSIAIPTKEEISLLIETAQGTRMELPVILAACCGLRRSEISALTWEDVDFENNTISITKAKVVSDKGGYAVKSPKTESGERTVRMFPLVADALKEAYSQSSGQGEICSIPSIITRGFERLLKRAGIRHYRFHDLRHYCCSVMLGLGIPKPYIADHLGHESERMIDEVYGHIMQDMKQVYDDNLNTYFSGAFPSSRNKIRNDPNNSII